MVNIAVVGFGFMGMLHTGNILKNSNINLSAIVDKNTDAIHEKLALQLGNFATKSVGFEDLSGVKIYDDFANCLKAEKLDACVIAVHTNLHYEIAKMALEAGLHVLLEKPFCLDVTQGQFLIDMAIEKNKILMIGHVVRFMPAYQTLKSWIESREFGNLEFLSLSRFSGIPSWGQWKEKQENFGSSGGALFDLVIHDIDFVQWTCGKPDNINTYSLPGKLSNYDFVSAFWKFGNSNLNVKIEGGNIFHTDYPFHASFTARFQNASILYSSKDPVNLLLATDSGTRLIPAGDANNGFSEELNYFVNCIINKEHPVICTPESALDTIKICYRHTRETSSTEYNEKNLYQRR